MFEQEKYDFEKFKKRPKFLFDLILSDGIEQFPFTWIIEADSFEKAREMLFSEMGDDSYKIHISRVYVQIFSEVD